MSDVMVSVSQGVAFICMNRPAKKNSLSQAMYQALHNAVVAAVNDPAVKVLCIRGEGDCFTAGNDLADFANMAANPSLGPTVQFMQALFDCPKPVVAEVHGLAVGIGTTMLLHCDFVVCADNSQFVLPFVNLGLVPEYAASYILPKLAGHRKAAEWLMLGEPFGASEAKEWGLVNQVVPRDALHDATLAVLHKLCHKPRQALLHTKALLRPDKDEIRRHIDLEIDVFLEQLHSEAAKEAFAAFLEKRRPDPAKYN